jgi:isopenicillin-N N-acyltransferase-like protein
MIPTIRTGGTPYAIGHDTGQQLRDLLQEAVAAYRVGFVARYGWDRVVALGLPHLKIAQRVVPRRMEEMRGMADGAGLDLPTLFTMNARQEIAFAAKSQEEDGCTSVGVPPDASADGHVLLAHNEDATPGWSGCTYVIHAEPDDAPAYLTFSYAGLLLHQGLNSAGIGSVGNALYFNDLRPGVPKLLAYRDALEATFLEDAIRRVIRPERANGNNHVLASREGEIYDLEVSGAAHALHYIGGKPWAHANHVVDAAMREREEGDLLNSRLRADRTGQLLSRVAGQGGVTLDDLRAILRDHANFPKSVCKHVAPGVNEHVCTIGSVIVDLTAGELHVCAGNPCEGEYEVFRLG